jgi:amino acid adenylation domain-containing protein/non-ribosomal peptide synthase protein (TIGR01720 family)
MTINKRIYYNVTHPQKRIWYIDKINSNSQLHNIGGSLKIKGNIDIDKLEKTINIIIKQNEGLRLRFFEENDQVFQYVADFEEQKIDFLDFSKYDMPIERYKKWADDIFKDRFLLENNQLYYFAICKINDSQYSVLLKIHHIIADGWSINIIQKQLCEIYSDSQSGNYNHLDTNCSYIDFIEKESEYLQSNRFLRNKQFWNDKFSNISEDFLYKTSTTLDGKRKTIHIDHNISNDIREFLKNNKCTMNTFFITILNIYLYKVIQDKNIVIGTPVFNRVGTKEKNTIGMFTSTMPFKLKLNSENSIKELIDLVNRELKLCFLNQKYPYDVLIHDLELNKKGYDSLFKVCVNYYNSKFLTDINGTSIEVEEYYNGNQSYSLQLIIKEEANNDIGLSFDYKSDEYTEKDIMTMYECMHNVIEQVIQKENIKVKDINIVNDDEINHKVYALNSTSSNYPMYKTIYELFEEQVKKAPYNIAITFKNQKLTYEELNKRSNQLAYCLRENGINKQDVIAIMATHSVELIVGILAILKAGGAYLPIDPNYPVERVNYMLTDSKSKMFLTNITSDKNIDFHGTIINLNDVEACSENKENLVKINNSNDLAYIIYTSGSTGTPKGVMIEHRGLVNYIWWAKKTYLKDNDNVVALYSSISFDLTVTSIFAPLVSGNEMIIYDNNEEEFTLYKIFEENKATVVKLTPAHMTLLKDMYIKNSVVRRFIVGGDNLKADLAKQIYELFDEKIEIYNEYGPTETVVGCMIHRYDALKDKGSSVPIGYPIDNVQVYVLDKDLNVVPNGIAGELFISGDGVARGYLNREELTNKIFISNPFIKERKMYKTGDTAKYIDDGVIEYVGRSDNQVKIRGYRIELGEIEKYLLKNECVKDVIVTVIENPPENKVLYAYIVAKRDIKELELKKWLLKFLPKYMIPTQFIFLKEFPLTINGKVNHSLLPLNNDSEKIFIESKNDKERILVDVIEDVLAVENISMNDNFYQLGGDSIKAIQVASRFRNNGLNIKVKDILNYDTIEEIATTITLNEENISCNQEECSGIILNTPIIEWFFNQGFTNENYYNQYIQLYLNKPLNLNNIKIAIDRLIKHHDTLRINYNKNSNTLYYNNDYLNEINTVKYFDLSQSSIYQQDKKIEELKNELIKDINIQNSILFRLYIFNLGERGQVLLFIAHHLIIDGISWRILLDDFFTMLNQLENNKPIVLPQKTYSFKEWAEQLHEYSKKDFHVEKAYWSSIFNKDVSYPIDFKEKEDIIKTSSTLHSNIDNFIMRDYAKKINEVYNIEINDVLIIALVITISKINNSQDVVIEIERHGREFINNYIDVTRTIGWFTSMFPACFRVNTNDLDCNIKSIKEQLRNIPNKGFNYGVLKYLKHELNENSCKFIRFNYLGNFDDIANREEINIFNIECGLDSDPNNKLTSLIDITTMIVNKNLKVSITYSNNKFKTETIKQLIDTYTKKISDILYYCWNKSNKEFTPSDFDSADISQEDLDMLFE